MRKQVNRNAGSGRVVAAQEMGSDPNHVFHKENKANKWLYKKLKKE